MKNLGPFVAKQENELDEPGEIPQRLDRPTHVPERNETDATARRGLSERALAVGGDGHVEVLGQGREERGDIGLSPAHLRKRDHQ